MTQKNLTRVLLVAALFVAALFLSAFVTPLVPTAAAAPGMAQADDGEPVGPAPGLGDREYAYYTERYWQTAAARENQLAGTDQARRPYTSYTDRYWQAAAARESQLAQQEREQEYAYYTERYWQAATARELTIAARGEPGQ